MITRQVIETIYKKYKKAPKSYDTLDMALLFDSAKEYHNIYFDFENEELVIPTIDTFSPFHAIPVSHIHAIVPFDEWVGIVLHSSIVFLNKKSSEITVHIKTPKLTLTERIKEKLRV
jgi:hypothetical protein